MGLTNYYPFECIKIESDEEKVVELYEMMLADGKKKGYTPVIIIEDEHGLMQENIKFAEDDFGSYDNFVKTCLDQYKELDPEFFFKARKSEYEEDGLLDLDHEEEVNEKCDTVYLGEKNESVFIAKIPTKKPYEIFAYVPMGGYNDCPDNITHMAIAKYWFEKYNAVPICIGSDTIQYKVDKLVDKNQWNNLALEQYLYCGDIVLQGIGSVENLKNTISKSKIWYFWWD